VVHFSACPEVFLSILLDQVCELALFLGSVKADGSHVETAAESCALRLGEPCASTLPAHHIPISVVGASDVTPASTTSSASAITAVTTLTSAAQQIPEAAKQTLRRGRRKRQANKQQQS